MLVSKNFLNLLLLFYYFITAKLIIFKKKMDKAAKSCNFLIFSPSLLRRLSYNIIYYYYFEVGAGMGVEENSQHGKPFW